MATTFSNPLYAPEAFEDYEWHQEGHSLVDTPTTADAGSSLAAAMDVQDSRKKPPRAKSRNSLFSRKSKKGTDATNPVMPEQPAIRETSSSSTVAGEKDGYVGEGYRSRATLGNVFAGLSILPEPIPELPAWYNSNLEWIAASFIQFRARYPIHNPAGPRYYKNYHLIPPSELAPSMRPPSIFSPSFPPMTTTETSEDQGRLPGPSRTPSGSPLPTPNSSQVRINEAGGRRTRKTSQTAHDNVDLLDVTDPWGSHWHHESPYDIGMTPSPVSVDAPEGPGKPRSRMSSMSNAPARHRSVIPSPLSQSTSAIHLQPLEPDGNGSIPRRLSRRRRPGIRGFFVGSKDDDDNEPSAVASAPATPVDHPVSSYLAPPSASGGARVGRKLSKRGMSLPAKSSSPTRSARPPSVSTQDTNKKRGSIFGALAKRFTVVRRHPNRASVDDTSHRDTSHREMSADTSAIGTPPPDKLFDHERKSSGLSKRVPPPTIDPEPAPEVQPASPPPQAPIQHQPGPAHHERGHSDHDSVLEAPFSIGRLTIANPDAEVDTPASPARTEVPLPPEKDAIYTLNDQHRSVGQILEQDELVGEPEQLQAPSHVPSTQTPSQTADTNTSDGMMVPKQVTPVGVPSPTEAPVVLRQDHTSNHVSQSSRHGSEGQSAQTINSVPEIRREDLVSLTAPVSIPDQGRSKSHQVPEHDEYLPPPPPLSSKSSVATDDSPLSRASIIANPPTPHMSFTSTLPEINTPPVVLTPQPVVPVASTSAALISGDTVRSTTTRDGSPTKGKDKSSTRSRQTETFRLIRSPSGTVHPTSETITADGEMWEIVETKDSIRRSRTKDRSKSNDQDVIDRNIANNHERSASQSEEPRHRKSESGERYKHSSGRQHGTSAVLVAGASSSQSRARSVEGPRRPAIPEQLINQKEQRSPTETRERHTSPDKRAVNGTHTSPIPDVNKSQKHNSGSNDVANVHRRPSHSIPRPTSDIPSVDDFETFRAREAWEMDRLYKGRSWVEGPRSVMAHETSATWQDTGRQGQVGRSHTVHSTGHGSSHTSIVVQSSFHASSPAVHSMPSSSSYAAHPHSSSQRSPTHDHINGYRSYQESVPFPSRTSTSNPLPEPPREANYQPAPLPSGISDNGPSSPEYWNKYAGLTAAH